MARFDVYGIADLYSDLAALSYLPESVSDAILNAEADVIVEAQRKTIEEMQHGPNYTGISAKSIKKGSVRRGKKGPYISVYPQGDRIRNGRSYRNGEIAFINEYGKRGQPGRPAIRTANAQAADKAVAAGEKVYNNFLNSRNL